VQCWIKIHGLPLEYWQPCDIFSIAKEVGIPSALDDCTINKIIGFYARVLVDVHLLSSL